MLCSIVISTYRRPHLIERSVRSALAFCEALGTGEVIVVDDGGFDGTPELLQKTFAQETARGKLRLLCHLKNIGVSAAKNTGFLAAEGEWVFFLDSDDETLPENAKEFHEALRRYPSCPIFFFKCITPDGAIVGDAYEKPEAMDILRYFTDSRHGELFTAIRRDIDMPMPYIDSLRGFEGLGCLRIIRRHGPGIIWHRPLRRYYIEHADRLSSRRAMAMRGFRLARGHWLSFLEFRNILPANIKLRLLLKVLYYLALGTVGIFHKYIAKFQQSPVVE